MTEHMKWLQKIIEQSDNIDNTAQTYLYAVFKYILFRADKSTGDTNSLPLRLFGGIVNLT
jgi:hypothetical protein